MAETKPIPVRLAPGVISRLDSAARRMGTNRSALMKFLVQTFVESLESKGMGSLPHNWETIMQQLDGRTFGQQLGKMRQEMPSLIAAETTEPSKVRVPARKPVRYGEKPKPKKPKP